VPEEPERLGDWLRRQRKAAGLTQEELAERSGVSVRTVANLERGRTRQPYPSSVRSLARALGLPDAMSAELIRRYRLDDIGHTTAGSEHDPASPAIGSPILQHEPAAAGPGMVPRQLPPVTGPFVGRASALAALGSFLDDPGDGGKTGLGRAVIVSAIAGTAGVGKTSLSLYWAHRVANRFPDGQLYANLRGYDPSGGPASAAEIIRGFLHALQVDYPRIPAAVDEQAGLYRSLLAGKRMLVVLDNARDAAQVRPLLPGSPSCLVLVTSRSQLSGLVAVDGARLLTLDVLTEQEARDLLAVRLGAARAAAEPGAVGELTRLCVRLPLALCIMAARAALLPQAPLSGLVTELQEALDPLDALDAGEPIADLRTVFSWSYDNLTSQASGMFRLLSQHPGPDIGLPAAASLAGIPAAAARIALRDLTRAGLITERAAGRYEFHDLLRAYALNRSQLTDAPEDRQRALGRVLEYYLHTARAADTVLYPARWSVTFEDPLPGTSPEVFSGKEQARAWFDTERPALLKLLAQAERSGFDHYCWRLAWLFRTHLYARGYLHDLAATQRAALAAACRAGDREGQALVHLGIGRACTYLADYREAGGHLDQALAIFREIGHQVGEANTNIVLGYAMECQHRYRESLAFIQRAIDLTEASPDDLNMRFARMTALSNSGWVHAHVGSFPEARARSEEAIALCRQAGDPEGEAIALDNLGFVYSRLGEPVKAIACFRGSLDLLSGQGNPHSTAEILAHLAHAYQAAGDLPQARRTRDRAMGIIDELHLPEDAALRAKLRDLQIADGTPEDRGAPGGPESSAASRV
jgi:tetratricopeptide (TPR) repeat protein/transcriptional regulator with XRE-family HTH domain